MSYSYTLIWLLATSVTLTLCSNSVIRARRQLPFGFGSGFNINPRPDGNVDFGFGQGANILGFGGGNQQQFSVGKQGFQHSGGAGALVAGKTFGLGTQQGIGLGPNGAVSLHNSATPLLGGLGLLGRR